MTKLDDNTRLRHMLDAAEQAQRFMQSRSREDLDTDPMLLLAVVKAIEIVGEAATKVTQERQTAIPQLPWPQIKRHLSGSLLTISSSLKPVC